MGFFLCAAVVKEASRWAGKIMSTLALDQDVEVYVGPPDEVVHGTRYRQERLGTIQSVTIGYRTAQPTCRGPPAARSRLATTSVSGPLHVRAPRGRQGRSVRCNIQGTKPRSLPAPQQHLAHGHRELIDRKVRVDDTAVDRLVTVEYSCGLRLLCVDRLCA